ncbi:hypothetical protein ACEWY4_014115 [Coilia grayii]|uniref:Reverse transcriptase/retrotransposon-derived protein RNase H-like domain-containing protein n=1 Tax=Coilia grayii TaxID=363190 RepID=A0ABD1JRC4_9TELE
MSGISAVEDLRKQTSVRYLGHVVSRNGLETDPDKISALKTWPVPQTLQELKSFLSFAGYYRRFVKGYSLIVKPFHILTSGYPPLHKKSKAKPTDTRQKTNQYHDPKEPFGGCWTPECQRAFKAVIQSLTTAPVLAFAVPQRPYILHTDASTTGLGAVLYQEQESQLRVIGRQPHLPVDLAFKLPVQEGQHSSHSEYVRHLNSRLKESYKVAMEKAAKIAHKNEIRYDRHVTASDLERGDPVLVRNVRIRAKHKISDKWEPTVHRGEKSRPGTRANPVVEEESSSDEDDDALIPVWLGFPVPVVSESPMHPDLPKTDAQETEHIEPPGPCPVESPINAQNSDNPPEIDTQSDFHNLPDMSHRILESFDD